MCSVHSPLCFPHIVAVSSIHHMFVRALTHYIMIGMSSCLCHSRGEEGGREGVCSPPLNQYRAVEETQHDTRAAFRCAKWHSPQPRLHFVFAAISPMVAVNRLQRTDQSLSLEDADVSI